MVLIFGYYVVCLFLTVKRYLSTKTEWKECRGTVNSNNGLLLKCEILYTNHSTTLKHPRKQSIQPNGLQIFTLEMPFLFNL